VVAVDQRLQMLLQIGLVGGNRIDGAQRRQLERAAEDARDLDRQLLRHGQLIDAALDHDLDRVRQLDRLALRRRRKSADTAVEFHQATIAERMRQFLGEEGMPLRLLADQPRDRLAQRSRPQLLADQRPRFVRRQAVETQRECALARAQANELGRFFVLAHRPRRNQQQDLRHTAFDAVRERPGCGIEPVRVFEDEQRRAAARRAAKQVDQQVARQQRPAAGWHALGPLRFRQIQPQHGIEQRRERQKSRLGLQQVEHASIEPRPPAAGVVEAEQVVEEGAPRVVRRRTFDLVAAGDHGAHPAGDRPVDQIGDETALADARVSFDDDDTAALAGSQRFEAVAQHPPLLGAADDFGRPVRGQLNRPIDADRLLAALDADRQQRLEFDPLGGAVACGEVAEDFPGGALHQARGDVDGVADHRVLAALTIAAQAGEDLTRRQAEGRGDADLVEIAAKLERRAHGADFIVRVGVKRETPAADRDDPFVVGEQLVDGAAVPVHGGLHRHDGTLELIRAVVRTRVERTQLDEEHADPAELRQPVGLSGVEAGLNRSRHVRAQQGQAVGVQRKQFVSGSRGGSGNRRDADGALGQTADPRERRQPLVNGRRDGNFSRIDRRDGVHGIHERTARDQQFPTPGHSPERRHPHLTRADARAHLKPRPAPRSGPSSPAPPARIARRGGRRRRRRRPRPARAREWRRRETSAPGRRGRAPFQPDARKRGSADP
jgi:hypothetical protein